MQLGMIGLGRMGANMTRRLLRGDHEVIIYGRNSAPPEHLEGEGAEGDSSLGELTRKLAASRVAWPMVPAKIPMENTVTTLVRRPCGGSQRRFKHERNTHARRSSRNREVLEQGKVN